MAWYQHGTALTSTLQRAGYVLYRALVAIVASKSDSNCCMFHVLIYSKINNNIIPDGLTYSQLSE